MPIGYIFQTCQSLWKNQVAFLGLLSVYIELAGKKMDKTSELEAFPLVCSLLLVTRIAMSTPSWSLSFNRTGRKNFDRWTLTELKSALAKKFCVDGPHLCGVWLSRPNDVFQILLVLSGFHVLRIIKDLAAKRVELEGHYKKPPGRTCCSSMSRYISCIPTILLLTCAIDVG